MSNYAIAGSPVSLHSSSSSNGYDSGRNALASPVQGAAADAALFSKFAGLASSVSDQGYAFAALIDAQADIDADVVVSGTHVPNLTDVSGEKSEGCFASLRTSVRAFFTKLASWWSDSDANKTIRQAFTSAVASQLGRIADEDSRNNVAKQLRAIADPSSGWPLDLRKAHQLISNAGLSQPVVPQSPSLSVSSDGRSDLQSPLRTPLPSPFVGPRSFDSKSDEDFEGYFTDGAAGSDSGFESDDEGLESDTGAPPSLRIPVPLRVQVEIDDEREGANGQGRGTGLSQEERAPVYPVIEYVAPVTPAARTIALTDLGRQLLDRQSNSITRAPGGLPPGVVDAILAQVNAAQRRAEMQDHVEDGSDISDSGEDFAFEKDIDSTVIEFGDDVQSVSAAAPSLVAPRAAVHRAPPFIAEEVMRRPLGDNLSTAFGNLQGKKARVRANLGAAVLRSGVAAVNAEIDNRYGKHGLQQQIARNQLSRVVSDLRAAGQTVPK